MGTLTEEIEVLSESCMWAFDYC